jgi:hypothetical protein
VNFIKIDLKVTLLSNYHKQATYDLLVTPRPSCWMNERYDCSQYFLHVVSMHLQQLSCECVHIAHILLGLCGLYPLEEC